MCNYIQLSLLNAKITLSTNAQSTALRKREPDPFPVGPLTLLFPYGSFLYNQYYSAFNIKSPTLQSFAKITSRHDLLLVAQRLFIIALVLWPFYVWFIDQPFSGTIDEPFFAVFTTLLCLVEVLYIVYIYTSTHTYSETYSHYI